jgi:hypothetical protein
MPAHGPLTYRQRDLEAAMRAAKRSGFAVRSIRIDRDGTIVIEAAEAASATGTDPDAPEPNPWDAVREKI